VSNNHIVLLVSKDFLVLGLGPVGHLVVSENVGVLGFVDGVHLSILDGELTHSEGVLLLGAVGLAELGDVVDELVFHIGHGGGDSEGSEGGSSEGSH